jgi:hypothetical protein
MSKPYIPFETIQYCGAKTRTTEKPCRGSAMKNGRCRFHGGASKGRPITTGLWTKEAMQQRKEVSSLIRDAQQSCADI